MLSFNVRYFWIESLHDFRWAHYVPPTSSNGVVLYCPATKIDEQYKVDLPALHTILHDSICHGLNQGKVSNVKGRMADYALDT